MSKKKSSQQRLVMLCTVALLCAMQVILARWLVIPIGQTMRISFSFIPVVIAARCYGAGASVLVYALGDFIGTMLPGPGNTGAYLPGFTITAAVSGLIFGLFLQKKGGAVRIVLSVLSSQVFCTLLMNSLWLNHYYGMPLGPTILGRVLQSLVVGGVEIVFMLLFLEKICGAIKLSDKRR